MSNQRKLTRIKFFAIKRELASTNRRQEDIAADYDVSASLVAIINRAVTWENYLAYKTGRSPIRSGRVKRSDPVVRKEKAQKTGLNPVSRDERQVVAALKVNEENTVSPSTAFKLAVHEDRLDTQRAFAKALDARQVKQATHIGFLWLVVVITLIIAAVK